MSLARTNENARRLHRKALSISSATTDLRAAMKRVLWLTGMTIDELAARTGRTYSYWQNRLSRDSVRWKISPADVDTFAKAVGARPRDRKRLHRLGAINSGWDIPLEDA
ncbi:MAG: hypothetical protein AB7V08_14030 [Elusimicrobiales bacterium]